MRVFSSMRSMDQESSVEASTGVMCMSPADWTERSRFCPPAAEAHTRPTVVPSGSSVRRRSVLMLASARRATEGGASGGMTRRTS